MSGHGESDLDFASIAVIHLLPLPGSPRWGEDLDKVVVAALDDARACEDGGADAVIIENFGDVPFSKGAVPPETIAAMAVVGATVRDAVGTSVKRDGKVFNPVDSRRVIALRKAIQRA